MFDDSLAEMSTLPEAAWEHPWAAEMRILVLTQARRLDEALECSRALCTLRPDEVGGFIHAAFCLHELGRSLEARDTLLSGPTSLKAEPTFYYNLACYECALGNLNEARSRLDRSISMNRKFREFSLTDPDLAPLRS